VTTEELDIALEELEVRLERLRALYEQYFLGFEKIEPSVARKDVDRRIYILRREKIRNTGKRFKLQTIIQRYNTFQMYWQRICREIENGTYRRHVLRAERQLAPGAQLTIASRRRFGRLAAGDSTRRSSSAPPGSGFPPAEPATAEMRRPSEPAPDSGDVITRRPPPPSPSPSQSARPPRVSSRPPTDKLELDMGFLGSWSPPAPKPPAAAPPNPPAEKAAPPPKPGAKPRSSPRAAAAPIVQRPAPPPKPRANDATQASSLSDDHLRELHQRLSTLKKENREAGQVSFESLSRSVRETEAKLRAQHKDRKIEFEVVLRDGKAIVKPRVR